MHKDQFWISCYWEPGAGFTFGLGYFGGGCSLLNIMDEQWSIVGSAVCCGAGVVTGGGFCGVGFNLPSGLKQIQFVKFMVVVLASVLVVEVDTLEELL